jgi:hypothetical protein
MKQWAVSELGCTFAERSTGPRPSVRWGADTGAVVNGGYTDAPERPTQDDASKARKCPGRTDLLPFRVRRGRRAQPLCRNRKRARIHPNLLNRGTRGKLMHIKMPAMLALRHRRWELATVPSLSPAFGLGAGRCRARIRP